VRVESGRATPSVPPGLTKPIASAAVEGEVKAADSGKAAAEVLEVSKNGAGSVLTAVPADLEGLGSRPSSRASLRKVSSHVVPAVPLRPATPTFTPGKIATPRLTVKEVVKVGDEGETPTKASHSAAEDESTKPAKEVSVPEKEVTVQAESAAEDLPKEQQADVTASSKAKAAAPPSAPTQKSVPKGMQPAAKGQATVQASSAKAAPVTPSKPDREKNDLQKRKQPPGKLDIAAAVNKEGEASSAKVTESVVQSRDVPPASATSKPESPSVASPAVKLAPKTLRVVATPKTETPPAGVTTPKEPVPPIPAAATAPTKLPSRQPSVASINPPGTPSSEQVSISDNLSMASTSQSRANSPPPSATTPTAAGSSKVGSAPVRAKTKSQLKKERQERAKAIEEEKPTKEEEPVAKAVPEEPAQEAIVSRKKKTKREKEPKPKPKAPPPAPSSGTATTVPATGESTPTASRPVTPQQAPATPVAAPQPKVEEIPRATKASKPSTPTSIAPAPLPPTQSPGEPSPPPTPTLNAAQLVAELKATAPEIQKCIDSLFRSPGSNHYKPNQPITAKDIANFKQEFKVDLTQREVHALLNRKIPAVRHGGEDGRVWDRGMVTPTGAHLRALTQELEQRFLELEKAINELPDELKFRPTKPQNDVKFPSIDLEALKRQFENIGGRGVSVMEQMVQDGSAMKKGAFLVDEASRYINEFVMPPATPPPSAGGVVAGGKAMMGGDSGVSAAGSVNVNVSLEVAERQLSEARRVSEERDVQLKKAMKKNKRVLGMG
jgi:CCR4-NOT transcription complex subunit 4